MKNDLIFDNCEYIRSQQSRITYIACIRNRIVVGDRITVTNYVCTNKFIFKK